MFCMLLLVSFCISNHVGFDRKMFELGCNYGLLSSFHWPLWSFFLSVDIFISGILFVNLLLCIISTTLKLFGKLFLYDSDLSLENELKKMFAVDDNVIYGHDTQI